MRVGVLTTKKEFKNHQRMLAQCGIDGVLIINAQDLNDIDGFILADDDRIMGHAWKDRDQLHQAIKGKVYQGMPIFGISQGMMVLAREMKQEDGLYLRLLEIKVEKDGFHLIKESFEVPLKIDVLGKAPFPGIFIGAPYIRSIQPNVGILAMYQEKIVMVRQGNILGASFHPELTDDLRVYLYFKQMIEDAKG